MLRSTTLAAVTATLLVGCATPKVKYQHFTQASPRTEVAGYADTYMLPKTVLTLEATPSTIEAKEGVPKVIAYTLMLRRQEDPARSFAITPSNRFGVTTNVALVKVNNTQLIQSATVSVKDKRKEYITAAFKLLATVAGVVAPTAAAGAVSREARLPIEIDTLEKISNCTRDACVVQALSAQVEGIGVRLIVAPVPPDAMSVDQFVNDLSSASGVLASSACRQATVRVAMPEGMDDLVSHFALADPRYVQLISLPAKGSITAHSECGFSVVAEDAQLVSDLDVADSLLTELIKLREAYEKSTDGNKKDVE